MQTNTRLYIVTGIPGARTDFVAGWLGNLPGFVDSQWTVDVETGRSYTTAGLIREIDKLNLGQQTLRKLLKQHHINIDAQASAKMALSMHGFDLDEKVSSDDLPAIAFVNIDTDQADHKKIYWEYVVKTYLNFDRRQHAWMSGQHYNVDRALSANNCPINDYTRCLAVEKVFENYQYIPNTDFKQLPVLQVPYADIVSEQGSHQLESLLQLKISARAHALWSNNLPLAESPSEVWCFGRWWRFSDHFDQ
jgi:hypothetical protein